MVEPAVLIVNMSGMPLLGTQEKGELEALILGKLEKHYKQHGPMSLLEPGLRIVVTSGGVELATRPQHDSLAQVETRSLFTALCYLAADGTQAMPHESLEPLATEATSSLAAQINKLLGS